MTDSPGFAFSVIGVNHGHIYGQVRVMLEAGCRLKAFFAPEDDLAAQFSEAFPDALRVSDERAILDDAEVKLVVGVCKLVAEQCRRHIGYAAPEFARNTGFVRE